MIIQNCNLIFDQHTNTLTVTSKSGAIYLTIKIPAGNEGTITRIKPDYDGDSNWIAVPAADTTVFEDGLFSKKELTIHSIEYSIT